MRVVVGDEVIPVLVDAHRTRGSEIRTQARLTLRSGRVVRAADQLGELLRTEPPRELEVRTPQRCCESLHVLPQHGGRGADATPVLADGTGRAAQVQTDADGCAMPRRCRRGPRDQVGVAAAGPMIGVHAMVAPMGKYLAPSVRNRRLEHLN